MPTDYPAIPPRCVLTGHEYATPYLSAIQQGLDARLAKLPKRFSLSQLLDTWEMSVRQASAPKTYQQPTTVPTTTAITTATTITTVAVSTTTATATTATNPVVTNGISTNSMITMQSS